MANLAESSTWEPGIYQLEEEDLVQGGPDGIDNTQAKQLANRTAYLKVLVDALAEGKQPLDATLTALAGLVGAVDKLAYFNGADTAALTTLTAFARTLLDDADATTMRTTLGLGAAALLAVGTTAGTVAAGNHAHAGYQPADADLTAIAALASAANTLPYATGAGAWALTTLTAFARTLLDDADATTMRTTLGLGDMATKTVATDFLSSIAANGYQKFPSGLIIQWGQISSVPSGSSTTVTLPIAFPNACLIAKAERVNVGTTTTAYASWAQVVSASQIAVYNGTASALNHEWFAIGW